MFNACLTPAFKLRGNLIPIPRGVILWTNHQTPPLLRPTIDRLHDVDQLLLILEHPVQFVVISRPEITHHMLVAEEEHQRHAVVEFVHLLEVRYLVEIADVDDGEVLDSVGDAVEHFILAHAVGVPVAAKADDYETFFFGEDCLVDMPAGGEMGKDDRAHGLFR